jgi:two-component system KDP operon response regulator KdpE
VTAVQDAGRPGRLLLVDDDDALQRALRIGLSARGYEVVAARTGTEGLTQAALERPDVVVLDLGLPDLDGLEVLRRLRQWSSIPVIVLSAAGSESRKVAALDAGADDYVTKPFGMAELEARLRVALRRREPAEPGPSVLVVGPLDLDLVHHSARRNGHPLDLTAREFDLLSFLARHVGQVCTREMILSAVWGPGYGDAHHLRVYVHRLRRKLGPAGDLLRTRSGIGYELVESAAD